MESLQHIADIAKWTGIGAAALLTVWLLFTRFIPQLFSFLQSQRTNAPADIAALKRDVEHLRRDVDRNTEGREATNKGLTELLTESKVQRAEVKSISHRMAEWIYENPSD